MTTLEEMIALARKLPPMTPAEKREQRLSFVYGNCHLDNELITREMIDEADAALSEEKAASKETAY